MKHFLLSFILSVAAFASAHADGYTGIVVTDNEGQQTYYLFEEQPTVRYTTVDDVMNACLCVTGETGGTKVDLPVATSGTNADVTNNSLKPTTLSDGSLAAMESNVWALGAGNQFLRYTGTAFIHNRAYLVHEKAAGAKAMRIVFDDEATGIDAAIGGKSVRGASSSRTATS